MLSNVLTKEVWVESFSDHEWKFHTLTIKTNGSRLTALTSLSRIQGEGAAKAEIVEYTVDLGKNTSKTEFLYTRPYESERDVFGNRVVREWWIAEGRSRITIDNGTSVTFRLGAGPHTFAHFVCAVFAHQLKSMTLLGHAISAWANKVLLKDARADRCDETSETHVVFDRATGSIVHVHHSMPLDTRAPEKAQLAADALRLAEQLTDRDRADLDTISVRDADLEQRRRLKVDVTSRRIIAIDEPKGN